MWENLNVKINATDSYLELTENVRRVLEASVLLVIWREGNSLRQVFLPSMPIPGQFGLQQAGTVWNKKKDVSPVIGLSNQED